MQNGFVSNEGSYDKLGMNIEIKKNIMYTNNHLKFLGNTFEGIEI